MSGYRDAQQPVLVTAFNGWVIGLDVNTGQSLWEHSVGGTAVRIVVTDDRVYAASDEMLAAFEYPSGRPAWRIRITGTGYTLLVVGDRIFVGGNGEVECVSTDGRPLFKNAFKGKGLGPVALAVPGAVAQGDVNT